MARQRNNLRLLFATLSTIAALPFLSASAVAEWSASLPALASCFPASRPTMPPRWRAVGLMMPFLQGQLDVGEFVYDETARAMRATVYGVESGAIDLLITSDDTYRLSGPHDAPTACVSLGQKFLPPTNRWLAQQAVCTGETQVGAKSVQWWKTPGNGAQATWHWFTTGTRLPWRSLFLSRASDPAVIGDYAMTYFPTFTPLAATRLTALQGFCQANTKQPVRDISKMETARDLMLPNDETSREDRLARLPMLIPGLSHEGCARAATPRWPDKFVMTAMISPIQFADNPYSALIYYDWAEAKTQLALMLQGRPITMKGIVSLKPKVGYRLTHGPTGGNCEAVFPGIVRPNWMSSANCKCRAVINNAPQLSPNETTQILSCPIKWQGRRQMWTWYASDGRPITFLEAGARGGGVMLADYRQWLPGETVPASNFELPRACFPPPEAMAGQAQQQPYYSDPSCSDCHTTD